MMGFVDMFIFNYIDEIQLINLNFVNIAGGCRILQDVGSNYA